MLARQRDPTFPETRMRARQLSLFLTAAFTATSVLASAGATAQAAARPSSVLHLASGQANAGGLVTVRYSAAHLPKHSSLVLQRTVGTAHAWAKVKVLVPSSAKAAYAGHTTMRAPQMGSYAYRILITTKAHAKVASAGRTLHVYADVPLATVMNTTTGTVQIGTSLFRFVQTYNMTFLHFDTTTCRSANLSFAGDARSAGATLTVIQETADPFTLTATPDGVVSGTVALTGNAADFSYSYGPNYSNLYVNGTLSCFTSNGRYPTPTAP
jgi:hypothetical protein